MNPSGTIYVCANTNLKYQSPDTIIFATETEKKNYFLNKVISGATFTNQMYTRSTTNGVSSTLNGKLYVSPGTSSVKVNCNISRILNADYMFYVEPSYGNKVFYNYITDVSYISDEVTLITFTEDVFMTWQNGVTIKPSYVVRETTGTDSLFELQHELPDFQSGELKTVVSGDLTSANLGMCLCVITNKPIRNNAGSSTGLPSLSWYVPGVISGAHMLNESTYGKNSNRADSLYYYCINLNSIEGKPAASYSAETIIESLIEASETTGYKVLRVCTIPTICLPVDAENKLKSNPEAIVCVCPDVETFGNVSSATGKYWVYGDFEAYHYQEEPRKVIAEIPFSTFTSNLFEGYSFKNNKMLCSPYCSIRIKNNMGAAIDLEPQHFNNPSSVGNSFFFELIGVLSWQSMVYAYPMYYMNNGQAAPNTSYRIALSPYPDIPYTVDNFAQYFQQNAVANAVSLGVGAFDLVQGVVPDSVAAADDENGTDNSGTIGSVIKLGNTIGDMLATAHAIKARGISTLGLSNAGVGGVGQGLQKFTYEIQSINYPAAQQVDDMFTACGYTIGHIKEVPISLNGRTRFHYVQTHGCNVTGNIPMYAKNFIADRFDKGIRLWSASAYLDYSAYNSLSV